MPAPAWLVWTGIRLCLVAVVVMWTVAWCTAPLYDPDIPSDHVVVEMGPLVETALVVGCLCVGLVVSAIVSSESAYRGAPLFFVVMKFCLRRVDRCVDRPRRYTCRRAYRDCSRCRSTF